MTRECVRSLKYAIVHWAVIAHDGETPGPTDFGKEAFWGVVIQCIVAKTPEWRTPITESL